MLSMLPIQQKHTPMRLLGLYYDMAGEKSMSHSNLTAAHVPIRGHVRRDIVSQSCLDGLRL